MCQTAFLNLESETVTSVEIHATLLLEHKMALSLHRTKHEKHRSSQFQSGQCLSQDISPKTPFNSAKWCLGRMLCSTGGSEKTASFLCSHAYYSASDKPNFRDLYSQNNTRGTLFWTRREVHFHFDFNWCNFKPNSSVLLSFWARGVSWDDKQCYSWLRGALSKVNAFLEMNYRDWWGIKTWFFSSLHIPWLWSTLI